jgi:hypothetical protein
MGKEKEEDGRRINEESYFSIYKNRNANLKKLYKLSTLR